ncbi:hypothetical protein IE81DRAFT_340250 [Ceraceosorus guamensis]|uniref:Calcium-channel protein CCH1 n=1 Tax=Ceraceosorus guamensis TaxID=1522189 RepID=A0A316W338_9BASI|nr:hypothetical protein IE81DRAFT_340250 [Ceraceosorus guamensis]PWN44200.1 hypothetical protein IE81DRAFT_340250 [Ceraceosorus guamensis]
MSRPRSPVRGTPNALQPPSDPAAAEGTNLRSSAQSGGGRTIASYYQGRYDGDMSYGHSTSADPARNGSSSRDVSPTSSPQMHAGLSRRLSRGDPDAAAQVYLGSGARMRDGEDEQELHIGTVASQYSNNRRQHGSSGSAASFYNPLESSFDEPFRSAPPGSTGEVLAGTLGPYAQSAGPSGHGRDGSAASALGDVGRMQSRHRAFEGGASVDTGAYDGAGPFHLDFSAPRILSDSPSQSPVSLRDHAALPDVRFGAAQGWSQFGQAQEVQSPGEMSSAAESPPMGPGKRSRNHLYAAASPSRMDQVEYFGQDDVPSEGPRLSHRSPAEIIAGAGGDSPLVQTARAGLDRVGKSIRRVSRRVVGFEQPMDADGLRGPHIRLAGEDGSDAGDNTRETPKSSKSEKVRPREQVLRGRSLGLLGPENKFRRIMARLLSNIWFEPLILCLIIVVLVTFVVQSWPSAYKDPRKPGYFDYWPDYVLLAIFSVFTLEVVARVVVSGLLINPPPLVYGGVVGGSVTNHDLHHTGRIDGSEDAEVESTDKLGSLEDPNSVAARRRRMSKSNTLDTFAELGDSLKNRANVMLYRHRDDHMGTSTASRKSYLEHGPTANVSKLQGQSPNTSPRLVTSHKLAPDGRMGFSEWGDTIAPTSRPGASQKQESSTMPPQASDAGAKFLASRPLPFAQAILAQRAQAANYAYLRHSWNRVDLLSVICFWVAFLLGIFHAEQTSDRHLYIFRAIAVLRAARLLTVTNGTTTILASLKMAAPLLVNVAFFTGFAMLLFSIIGVQAFRGSLRRSCIWVGDYDSEPGTNYTLSQFCGGHVDVASGQVVGPLTEAGSSLGSPKGYICPRGLVCVRSEENPEGGTRSFDHIFASLLQVVIIIGANNWSDTMYDIVDTEPFVSCLYFIVAVILLNFWLANLFVAVITNTFATITAETKHSAFADEKIEVAAVPKEEENNAMAQYRKRVANVYKQIWGWTKYFWLLAIITDLGLQASQASYNTEEEERRGYLAELALTVLFDVEILLRFISFVLDRDSRGFFASRRNLVDLFLALITSIIQIPVIHSSAAYPWLTFFQLARFYRVIAAVPRMQALLIRVFGSMSGLINTTLFLILMIGLSALLAAQLLRGELPQEDDDGGVSTFLNYGRYWYSFAGQWQIMTAEDWPDRLYSSLEAGSQYKQAVIVGIFLGGWMMFANFIVLSLFVAVINENFSVAEGQKRAQQLEMYLQKLGEPRQALPARLLDQFSPYRWLRERNQAKMSQGTGMSQGANAVDEEKRRRMTLHQVVNPSRIKRIMDTVKKVLRLDAPEEHVPLDTIRARDARRSISGESMLQGALRAQQDPDGRRSRRMPSRGDSIFDTLTEDEQARLFARERRLSRMRTDFGLGLAEPPSQSAINAEHATRWQHDPRIAQARLMNTHPSYEKSLWLFSSRNPFRRFCQSIVPPSYGERLFGRPVSRSRHTVYQIVMFLTIAASIVVAGVATPTYRRDWYREHGLKRGSWFSITEVSLSVVFLLEFFLKVVADGLAFTPNAYLLSAWNSLDLFVLATLVVNVITELAVIGGVSRFTRSLKAFRALRLINLASVLRNTFHALVAGGGRFIDASVLAILYIVPYAVWGQNLFSGLLYACNDTGDAIAVKADCIGEYSATASQWSFLAPRVWDNPTDGSVYSFDDFRSALLILFEIVSLEGWVAVMTRAMSIVGRDQQPQPDARQINALFFLVYNLVGAVIVLTIFVSVIIEQFQTFSGAAFLTNEQRQWVDLKRLIKRQRPSKRPKVQPKDAVRAWCFARATQKHGWWSRMMTFLYFCNIIVLATQQFSDPTEVERARDWVYVGFAVIYAIDIIVRLMGLGWRAYKNNFWNIYDLVVVAGTFATTLPLLSPTELASTVDVQLQKIFLTAVAFKLVQKNNALNQLFKTAVASLPAIGSLFALWLVFFITFAIMFVEVFGLTRWGENETYSKNFSTFFGSVIFLSALSTGEGWNQYMHDYTVQPPECTPAASYLDTDCGTSSGALTLFIAWNVISMYLFLNMFTGTVVENFSYVFQLGGKPTLSREQMRAFKKTWAAFDPERKGYLQPARIVPFLNALNGIFEVRVYLQEGRLSTLRAAATPGANEAMPSSPSRGGVTGAASEALARLRGTSPLSATPRSEDEGAGRPAFAWPPTSQPARIVAGIDVDKLGAAIDKLDSAQIKERRRRFERIYQEMMIAIQEKHREEKGLPFTDALIILAHHLIIDDEQALSLEELLERRMLWEKVDMRIEANIVRGMLRQMYLRQRFLAVREERRRASISDAPIPTINVDAPEAGASTGSRQTRPQLQLNTSSPVVTPPAGLAVDQDYMSAGLKPGEERLSPSRRSPDGAVSPAITISPADVSLEELVRRASPLIESFQHTAWGGLARRVSRDARDLGSPPIAPAAGENPWQRSPEPFADDPTSAAQRAAYMYGDVLPSHQESRPGTSHDAPETSRHAGDQQNPPDSERFNTPAQQGGSGKLGLRGYRDNFL